MKRRGMYSSNCFFKPYLAPTTAHSLNRFNDGQSRVYPYGKGQTEYTYFEQDHNQKTCQGDVNNTMYDDVQEKTLDVLSEKLDREYNAKQGLSRILLV